MRHLVNISTTRAPPLRTPEAVPKEACAFPLRHTHLCANNRLERNEAIMGIQDRWKEDGAQQHPWFWASLDQIHPRNTAGFMEQ